MSNSIEYEELPRVTSVYPLFGYADAENFTSSITVTGIGFSSLDQLYFGDYAFQAATTVTSTSMEAPLRNYQNISYVDGSTPFGKYKTPVNVGLDNWGYTKNEVAYTFVNHFEVVNYAPVLVDSTGDTIYFNGTGLIPTPYSKCKFGSLTAVSGFHLNSTTMGCAVPFVSDVTAAYPVSISLNGEDYEDVIINGEQATLRFVVDITVTALDPGLSFESASNIRVDVYATTIYDIDTLSCKIHEIVILGEYNVDANGDTYVTCVIPTYSYLVETALSPISETNAVTIEVSNNGEDFSDDGLTFKFVAVDQAAGASPAFGPAEGGTTVAVAMYDLPASSLFTTSCLFPGYDP